MKKVIFCAALVCTMIFSACHKNNVQSVEAAVVDSVSVCDSVVCDTVVCDSAAVVTEDSLSI
jgi:hypothetical protein